MKYRNAVLNTLLYLKSRKNRQCEICIFVLKMYVVFYKRVLLKNIFLSDSTNKILLNAMNEISKYPVECFKLSLKLWKIDKKNYMSFY